MGHVHLKVKDVDEFFEELYLRCKQKTAYSLIKVILAMGVSSEEVQKWAKSNENWLYTLELCLELCHLNLQDANLLGNLSDDEAKDYLREHESLKKDLL